MSDRHVGADTRATTSSAPTIPAAVTEGARGGGRGRGATSRHETGRPSGPSLRRPVTVLLLVVASVAGVYGLLLRLWLLVHLPIWGDEATVGLMARAIDEGHFTAFYWGQHYGGAEPYVVALALKVGGGGEPALNATPAVLAVLAALLVGGLVVAAGGSRILAVAAGATVWCWPYVTVWQSVREGGFRAVTMCCGIAAVLLCTRTARSAVRPVTFALLGLVLGLGFWASPEIAYFALPCLVLLAGWWTKTGAADGHGAGADTRAAARHRRTTSSVSMVAGIVVGSLPWWYANAHTGFASVQRSALPANGGLSYLSKLSVFFHFALPMQLGVRAVSTGAWIGGAAGQAIYVVLCVLIAVMVARAVVVARGGPAERVPLALASGVVAFPFLYAAAPGTGYWNDGRYGISLPVLLVALFGTLLVQLTRARTAAAWTAGCTLATLGLAGALCLTVAGAHAAGVPTTTAFFSDWHNGDDAMQHAVDEMRAHHISAAYGTYWTAYDLDFLSRGRPLVSPSPLLDVSRSPAIASGVASSKDPAWLFFAPERAAEAGREFMNPEPGPGGETEQVFESRLRQLGVPYRVVKLGLLDAVVPSRKILAP